MTAGFTSALVATLALVASHLSAGCDLCGYGGKRCSEPWLAAEVTAATGEPSMYDLGCLATLPVGESTQMFLYWFDDTGEHPYKFADVEVVDVAPTLAIQTSARVADTKWDRDAWTLDLTATSIGEAWITLTPDSPARALTFAFATIAAGEATVYIDPEFHPAACEPAS